MIKNIENWTDQDIERFKSQGSLEEDLHASNFKGLLFQDLKALFDSCDKAVLQQQAEQQGHQAPIRDASQQLNPFSVFRGCVGNEFRQGMSWTTDLYQAIKYPKSKVTPIIRTDKCFV
jgi:hypothetical protein